MAKEGQAQVRTLRYWVAVIELEYVLPALLPAVMVAAAVAEARIISVGVDRVYAFGTGLVTGITIALLQMAGSMLWASFWTHNMNRKRHKKSVKAPPSLLILYRLAGVTTTTWSVEDPGRSEPRMPVPLPAAASIGAGLASALIGLALYARDGLDLLGVVLASVAPLCSVAAAVLISVFASGEHRMAEWREPAATSAGLATTERPPKSRWRQWPRKRRRVDVWRGIRARANGRAVANAADVLALVEAEGYDPASVPPSTARRWVKVGT